MVTRIKAVAGAVATGANGVLDMKSLIAPQTSGASLDGILANPLVQTLIAAVVQKVSNTATVQKQPQTFDEALQKIEGKAATL